MNAESVTADAALDAAAPGHAASLIEAWCARVHESGRAAQLRGADFSLTRQELQARVARLWSVWARAGLQQGDRVAVQLQNSTEMVQAVLAAWWGGAVIVPVNPMYRQRELEHVLADSGAAVLVFEREAEQVALPAAEIVGVDRLYSASDIAEICGDRAVAASPPDGGTCERTKLDPSMPALITYTSGTTGPPKGAVATHGNLLAGARVYRDAAGVDESGAVLAMAPMCHITGMVGHLAAAVLTGAELVLIGRFDAAAALDAIERHQVTFTIGALTAYRALLGAAAVRPRDVSSLRALYSGGAPVAPAVAAEVERAFGVPLGNAYGLTESTSISHLTPLGQRGPIDPSTGALSIGRPAPGTRAWIVDESGHRLPAGEPGELMIDGPGVVAGYWRNEAATDEAIVGGALRTGDVAVEDAEGWFYLIDRIKDQINASGYKIWPREVEDVLYEHPAVAEAAVFGVSDDYRGETVVAAVVLRDGATASSEDLIAFTRERLAPYKCPRRVRLLAALPATSSGKILRRELRLKEETQ